MNTVGLTTVLAIPESASTEDILAIVASIASVALGVLCGVEFHAWLTRAGGRVRRVGRIGLRVRGALALNRSVLYGVTVRVAISAVVVGVFCTWLAQGRLTLSGIEGPNNGWLCVLLAGPALLWARSMERGSWLGVVGVLGSALVIGWTRDRELARRQPRPRRRRLLRPAARARCICGARGGRGRPGGVASPRACPPGRYRRAPWSDSEGGGSRPARVGASLRPRLPAGAGDHATSELAAPGRRRDVGGRAGGDRGVRCERLSATARRRLRLCLVDRRDDRAVGRGEDIFPADLRGRRGRAVVGAHPHVRLARGPGRDGAGSSARAEAGGGCRGAGDRRRLRLPAERRCEGDVHRARRRRSADRGQRYAAARPRRASIRTIATSTGARTRSAVPTIGSST